jgi:hypothetical protein
MLERLVNWLNARFGFRPTLEPGVDGAHYYSREAAKYWFEALKRIGVLTIIAVAAKKTPILEYLYFFSLIIFMMPIGTWIGRWELDRRTTTGWSYSFPLIIVSTLIGGLLFNVGMQVLVMRLTEVLGTHR